MTVFLDVGAKRIQAYLARTPRLRGRRGASALLDRKRMLDWTNDVWTPHAQVNPDGKQTDGLLSLQFDDDVADRTVDDVTAEVTARLQRLAPGAEWDVYLRSADTYRDALRAGAAAERAGLDLLPGSSTRYIPLPAAAAEVPVVRFCDTCGLDSAVIETDRIDHDGPTDLTICADCSRRFLEGGYRTDERNWKLSDAPTVWQEKIKPGGLRAERDLRADVESRIGRTIGVVKDFDQLASLGSGDANHLCTVFIDGNRFGDLFAALKDADVSLHDLSEGLGRAVTAALGEATAEVTTDGDEFLCVVPHLVGGDDLLATVTAERAWDFVLAFLSGYHRRTAELAQHYRNQVPSLKDPTASAGLVFAHLARPFADTLELAEDALRRAKSRHRAAKPAVCWLDVTADGPQLPEHRSAPAVATLDEHRTLLDALSDIPPSGRAQLARMIADGDVAVGALAHRLGRTRDIRPFLSALAPMPLTDALALERWWGCRRPV